jgi:hypothetical protein
MKADTFAKLIVVDALIEAEIGYSLEHPPASLELFREGMVARIGDLVDEIDSLDSVAAARIYDAVVDFLAELPEEREGVVEATIRFRRAIDRTIARGMERRDLGDASTWAIVLDELLAELADEYHEAAAREGEFGVREYARVEALLARVRQAGERMLWTAAEVEPAIASDMDRLVFAIRNRRLHPTRVDQLILALQRHSAHYRPSTLTRIGGFVLRQVLRRSSEGENGSRAAAGREVSRSEMGAS